MQLGIWRTLVAYTVATVSTTVTHSVTHSLYLFGWMVRPVLNILMQNDRDCMEVILWKQHTSVSRKETQILFDRSPILWDLRPSEWWRFKSRTSARFGETGYLHWQVSPKHWYPPTRTFLTSSLLWKLQDSQTE